MKIKDLQTLQREQGAWAEKTFPRQPVESKIKHLQREVAELLKKPHDPSELADCLLLVLDIARRGRMTTGQLIEAAAAKLEINKLREWGPPDAEGVCEHVRTQRTELSE
jgi:Protein of unknown function (DUF550)